MLTGFLDIAPRLKNGRLLCSVADILDVLDAESPVFRCSKCGTILARYRVRASFPSIYREGTQAPGEIGALSTSSAGRG